MSIQILSNERMYKKKNYMSKSREYLPFESIGVSWSSFELEIVDDEDNNLFKLLVTIGAHWSPLEPIGVHWSWR